MLVYNETFIVDETIIDEWLIWLKTNHIAAIMATGVFDSYKILTVLDSPNEGVTYCFQYHTDTVERYSDFYYKHMEQIHKTHNQAFDGRAVLFHTLMETVDGI